MEMIIVSEEVLELSFFKARGRGVLDKSLGGEERRGPSFPDPSLFKTNIANFPTPV